MEQKKRQLEENVDSLNEELVKISSQGTSLSLSLSLYTAALQGRAALTSSNPKPIHLTCMPHMPP